MTSSAIPGFWMFVVVASTAVVGAGELPAQLQKRAEQGDLSCQLELAERYYLGDGFPRDSAKSAHWFQKAADQGSAKAQCNLGVLYKAGEGVPQNQAKAVDLMRQAAQQGHAQAQ